MLIYFNKAVNGVFDSSVVRLRVLLPKLFKSCQIQPSEKRLPERVLLSGWNPQELLVNLVFCLKFSVAKLAAS